MHARAAAVVVHPVGPSREFWVVGDAALDHDRISFRSVRRSLSAARIATFAVPYGVGGSLERAHLAHPRDVTTVPLQAEPEVRVRVEPVRDWRELRHADLVGSVRDGHAVSARTAA